MEGKQLSASFVARPEDLLVQVILKMSHVTTSSQSICFFRVQSESPLALVEHEDDS